LKREIEQKNNFNKKKKEDQISKKNIPENLVE
jgi:hypothetical protein